MLHCPGATGIRIPRLSAPDKFRAISSESSGVRCNSDDFAPTFFELFNARAAKIYTAVKNPPYKYITGTNFPSVH